MQRKKGTSWKEFSATDQHQDGTRAAFTIAWTKEGRLRRRVRPAVRS